MTETWKGKIDRLICEFIEEELSTSLSVRFVNRGDDEISHHIYNLNVCIISHILDGRISIRIVIFGNNNYLILHTPLAEITTPLLKEGWESALGEIHRNSARYYRHSVNLIDQLKLKE